MGKLVGWLAWTLTPDDMKNAAADAIIYSKHPQEIARTASEAAFVGALRAGCVLTTLLVWLMVILGFVVDQIVA